MKNPIILAVCLTIFGCDGPDNMLSVDSGENASCYDSGTKDVPVDAGAERHLQPPRSDTDGDVHLEGTATADYDTDGDVHLDDTATAAEEAPFPPGSDTDTDTDTDTDSDTDMDPLRCAPEEDTLGCIYGYEQSQICLDAGGRLVQTEDCNCCFIGGPMFR